MQLTSQLKSVFCGICLTALPWIPHLVNAQPVKSLTLDEAIRTALINNPQLKAAQARLGVSRAEITTAGARLNPAIMTDDGIAEKTYRVGVEQTVELGGKRRNRIAVAQAQREVVQAEIDTTLLDVRASVRRAYTQLYNLQARQQNAQEILQTTEKLLDIAQKRQQAGDIATVDVLQAEIVSINAGNDVQTVAAQLVQARNTLNALLNQPLKTALSLTPPTVTPETRQAAPLKSSVSQAVIANSDADLDRLIQNALEHRPETRQLLKNLALTDRQWALAHANRAPNLNFSVGPDVVTGSGGGVNVFVMGSLTVPILNRQQGPIQEALARRAQLQQEQAALKNRIALEVTNAYSAFNANQERVKRYETALLPKAEIVVEKSRRSFQEGKAAILLPLNAQQAYANTRLGYLQALQDYQNSISDLERALGTGL